MNYTENHALPQWEKDDRIMMEDFNNAMATIDASLTRFAIGTYRGNDASERLIELPFKPKVVLVTRDGVTHANGNYTYYYGGLAVEGGTCTSVALADNGFIVKYQVFTSYGLYANYSSYNYSYIAFG